MFQADLLIAFLAPLIAVFITASIESKRARFVVCFLVSLILFYPLWGVFLHLIPPAPMELGGLILLMRLLFILLPLALVISMFLVYFDVFQNVKFKSRGTNLIRIFLVLILVILWLITIFTKTI